MSRAGCLHEGPLGSHAPGFIHRELRTTPAWWWLWADTGPWALSCWTRISGLGHRASLPQGPGFRLIPKFTRCGECQKWRGHGLRADTAVRAVAQEMEQKGQGQVWLGTSGDASGLCLHQAGRRGREQPPAAPSSCSGERPGPTWRLQLPVCPLVPLGLGFWGVERCGPSQGVILRSAELCVRV